MIASVEAPLTLLLEPVKIVRFDAVVYTNVALGLVPEVLDPVDVVLLVGEEF